MIKDGNYRLIGLKSIDLTYEIDNLINSANDMIIIGGYSFTKPSNYKSSLKKLINSYAKVKHCIFPIDLFRSKDTNRLHAIELINNGVSVSLEPDNHSKWLMNENEMYFGSANFTNYSIEKRIEVVTFKTFSNFDPLKKEFTDFTISSMNRMNNTSNRNRIKGLMAKNAKLVSGNKKFIKRLNPSIEKVKSTLEKISVVQSSINELLVNCYWLLDNKYYNQITREATYFSKVLSSINSIGNRIMIQYNNKRDFDKYIDHYNEYCDVFTNNFARYYLIANDFIQTEKTLPSFTTINKDLTNINLKFIQNHINEY